MTTTTTTTKVIPFLTTTFRRNPLFISFFVFVAVSNVLSCSKAAQRWSMMTTKVSDF